MRIRRAVKLPSLVLTLLLAIPAAALCGTPATAPSPAIPPVASASAYDAGGNAAKAQQLVDAAINLTDSDRAVQMLWQATKLDPSLDEAYMYLALYYDSRSQFDKVVEVYQQLVKYQPKEAVAYFNIGEAYMSTTPAKFDQALPYYRKAFELDPTNSFAALRIGEIYAQQSNRTEALRFLRLASADSKNPTVAAEADKIIREMGPS
jgi:tetratricopeptide (TPR) repeat protein